MDLKELGIGGFVVIGGAIYGISEYGLGDVLTEDIKYVSDVPMDVREAYMVDVTTQFTEFFGGAIYGTDTFDFVGDLVFETDAKRAMFTEVVQSDIVVPKNEVKNLKALHADNWMCDTEDTRMFTDKGWTYVTELKNNDGKLMVKVTCRSTETQRPELRGLSS